MVVITRMDSIFINQVKKSQYSLYFCLFVPPFFKGVCVDIGSHVYKLKPIMLFHS